MKYSTQKSMLDMSLESRSIHICILREAELAFPAFYSYFILLTALESMPYFDLCPCVRE